METQTGAASKTGVRWGRWLLALLLLGAVIAGYGYWKRSQGWETTDDAQIDGRIYPVSPKVGGTIVKLNVQDNQTVEAGAVLAEIDPRDFRVAADQAKADLAEAEAEAAASRTDVPIVAANSTNQYLSAQAAAEEARANVSAAEKQVDAAQARLQTAEAVLRQAKANSDRASRDLERFRTLIAKDDISRQQFDSASAAADAARAQVEANEAQVEEARQAVQVARDRVAQQRAQLARAESDVRRLNTATQQVSVSEARSRSAAAKVLSKRADLEQAELNLEYTVIRAPVRGVISQRNVELGQVVQKGQPLLAVVPLDDIWVVANFKESQLARIRTGQKAVISVDAYGGQSFHARVDSIAAATGARFSLLPPENATGNFVKVVQRIPVKLVFDQGQNTERVLRPGMSVVPKIMVE
jgi:membrane fusion protein (multidrug efflux system)